MFTLVKISTWVWDFASTWSSIYLMLFLLFLWHFVYQLPPCLISNILCFLILLRFFVFIQHFLKIVLVYSPTTRYFHIVHCIKNLLHFFKNIESFVNIPFPSFRFFTSTTTFTEDEHYQEKKTACLRKFKHAPKDYKSSLSSHI